MAGDHIGSVCKGRENIVFAVADHEHRAQDVFLRLTRGRQSAADGSTVHSARDHNAALLRIGIKFV